MALNLGALLGGNKGQGGIMSQLQLAQGKQQEQRQQAATFQALQQLAKQNGQPAMPGAMPMGSPAMPSPGGMPSAGGLNSPQGGPVPIGPAPSTPPPPTPQQGMPTGGLPQQGGAPSPRSDMLKQIDIVANMQGLNDAQKMGVLTQMGAFTAPMEKYTQQLEMAQQKLSAQQMMLDERSKTLVQLQQMRDATSGSNTDKRVGAEERGQDIGASNTDKRVSAQERGQDITSGDKAADRPIKQQRADTQDRAVGSKIIQGEEGLKIKQQNADTASDRAGTYKTGTMLRNKVSQQLADSKGNVDKARIAKLAQSASPENKKPFQAAKDKFDKAAALYQSLVKPGVIPAPDPEDVKFAKDKMDKFQGEMEQLANNGASPAAAAPAQKEKIKPGEEVRYDAQGNPFVNRNGQAVPAEP